MKKQSNLHENEVRENPLQYRDVRRLVVRIGKSREFVTKSGLIVTVEHLAAQQIQGVGKVTGLYRISDRGMVIFPLRAVGVRKYIRNN